jgi:NAD(P)H-flavin reductase
VRVCPLRDSWRNRGTRIFFIRQAYLNLSFQSLTTTKTKTQFLNPANLLILTVTLPEKRLNTRKPNTHFFLYQPFQWRGWENHPFTAVVTGPQTLTFYIRPYGKFTGRLMKSQNPRLIVEGPYSDSGVDLKQFDNVLLIAGGSGISATLSYLRSFIPSVEIQPGKKMKFMWAAREETMVREIVKRELSSLSSHAKVEIEIFITSPESQVWAQLDEKVLEGAENGAGGMQESTKELGVSRIKYHYGQRPDLCQAIDEVSEEGQQAAVVVCGPPGMADEGRAAVRQSLKKAGRIEFVDIGFAW